MDLLVIHEMNPERLGFLIVKEGDSRYESFVKAHGLMIGGNDSEYSEEILEFVGGLDADEFNDLREKSKISGNFTIIHCGIIM